MKKFDIKGDRKDTIILILILIIILLLAILVYSLMIKPAFDRYILKKQAEAQKVILNNMLLQLEQSGYIELYKGNESFLLVKYEPLQVQQLQEE
ncbi:hypothetical protein BMS3Abin17_00225 [archaeon BMS3Abin17]|nr:hypothetical protein BMS3Abin17_00225 [archaeon BMS3Abin17]HDZ60793.1 hypothetical protein [Candidatus Pacearchaeota archaeon]